ncbi:MAG TPA: thioredoxin-dependent thiol peroxidase [bacterium]|jgi:peroxiredoxin Q/BCP|nr:thioredoxin-dependent thiol peroxidase [bacterium]
MAKELTIGQKAPDFDLPSSEGASQSLKALKGRTVVLYFYPKDDTPGCTVEACEFGTNHGSLKRAGAVVLGVSPDGLESHAKFIAKFGLPFALLADEGHHTAEDYGVWVLKSMYGKEYMGVQRSTFLIDASGTIRRIWPKVKPEGHAAEVLAALKELE